MTSREIAELTGKRHDHVLRDTEKMLAELGETSPQIWGDLDDAYGRPQRVAFLPKRETLILVSGYSAAMRARIIDRWQELEGAANDPMAAVSDPLMLRAAVGKARRRRAGKAGRSKTWTATRHQRTPPLARPPPQREARASRACPLSRSRSCLCQAPGLPGVRLFR